LAVSLLGRGGEKGKVVAINVLENILKERVIYIVVVEKFGNNAYRSKCHMKGTADEVEGPVLPYTSQYFVSVYTMKAYEF
jgi:hypothetical protein